MARRAWRFHALRVRGAVSAPWLMLKFFYLEQSAPEKKKWYHPALCSLVISLLNLIQQFILEISTSLLVLPTLFEEMKYPFMFILR